MRDSAGVRTVAPDTDPTQAPSLSDFVGQFGEGARHRGRLSKRPTRGERPPRARRIVAQPLAGAVPASLGSLPPRKSRPPRRPDTHAFSPSNLTHRVGVEIMVTHNPLHRSGRAGFPHPALALGDDAKPPQGIGMTHARRRQPAVNEPPHAVPRYAAGLTSSRERAMPEATHLKPKDVQRVAVRGHAVIADVPADDRAQPRADCRNGVVHTPSGVLLAPCLDPQVKDVMEVDVRPATAMHGRPAASPPPPAFASPPPTRRRSAISG